MRSEDHHKLHPCANCHTNLIRRKGGICRQCYEAKSLDRKLAKAATKENERQQRQEARKQQEIKQAKRRHKKAQSPCPSIPRWMIKLDERTRHEIGRCAYYQNSRCENTDGFCPLNGTIDYTKLQEKEHKTSSFARGVDNLGIFPASKQRRKELSDQAKQERAQVSVPQTVDAYHAPTRRIMPLDSRDSSWDDVFRVIEG